MELKDSYDVVVVGGGPGGTTVGHLLAKRGWDVLVLEKAEHPRFMVGESLLPMSTQVWDELGVWETFDNSRYDRKYGAWFDFADGQDPEPFVFGGDAPKRGDWSWNVERAWFDEVLWNAAVAAGVDGRQNTAVTRFLTDGEGTSATVRGVEVETPDGPKQVTARLTVDASGRQSLLGRQLGIRAADPKLNMTAMYAHYSGATLVPGQDAGTITILGTAWGWIWMIPFSTGDISVGIVVRSPEFAKRVKGRKPADVYDELLAEIPSVSQRLGPEATRTRDVETTANFSFRCAAHAGPGWALVGDAAAFVDPVFSSGVHLAMEGGRRLVLDVDRALRAGKQQVGAGDLKRYTDSQKRALTVFTRFIYDWYDDTFRLAFMRPPPSNPIVQFVKRRILRALAGDVYNPWKVIPYLWMLEKMSALNAMGVKQLNGGTLPAPGMAPSVVPGRVDKDRQLSA